MGRLLTASEGPLEKEDRKPNRLSVSSELSSALMRRSQCATLFRRHERSRNVWLGVKSMKLDFAGGGCGPLNRGDEDCFSGCVGDGSENWGGSEALIIGSFGLRAHAIAIGKWA